MQGLEELQRLASALKTGVTWIVPIIIIILSIITAAGIISWGQKVSYSIRVITKNPGGVAFWVILLITGLAVWFMIASKAGIYHGVL
jgi:hypothetical protein